MADYIDAAVTFSLRQSGCEKFQLKPEQREALSSVLERNDTIVVLPTGYGKSLIYLLLPFVTAYHRRSRGASSDPLHSMVLVIEPLSSLVEDQVKRATSMKLRAASLPYHRALYSREFKAAEESNVSAGDRKLFNDIRDRYFDVVFSSPEAMVYDAYWRNLLLEAHVRDSLSAIVVDEAHCILEW